MKSTCLLQFASAVILSFQVIQISCYSVQKAYMPTQKKVTWAKVLDNPKENVMTSRSSETGIRRSLSSSSSIFQSSPSIIQSSPSIFQSSPSIIPSSPSIIPSSPSNIPSSPFAKRSDSGLGHILNQETRKSDLVSEANAADSQNIFQKRALDLLYHKFVEPRIHKNIEPRPSLISELIQTFESHVQKDLAAWNRATPHAHGGNALYGSSAPVVQAKPETSYQQEQKPIEQITSVAGVEQGENEDTFVVTDETGVTHVVSVDDIINSLAQMDEAEISKLFLGTSVGQPDSIERRSSSVHIENNNQPLNSKTYEDLSLKQNIIMTPTKRQVSPKIEHNPYVDENEIILIKSEDGDTRLVTRKDVMLSAVATVKKDNGPQSLPSNEILTTPSNENKIPINIVTSNSKSTPYLTLDELANIHVSDAPLKNTHASDSHKRSPSIESNIVGFSSKHHFTDSAAGLGGLDSIRESLAEMRKKQQREKEVLLPSAIPPTFQRSAPNSPPVQILNSPPQGAEGYLLQSPITIQQLQTQSQQTSDSGIRDKVSNFFSRLMGKKVNNVDISHRPKTERDQYVQVVMPNPNSHGMEQVTIPLPKPIHYETRHTRSTTEVGRRSSQIQEDFQVPTKLLQNRYGRDSSEPMDIRTAESILTSAKVPESVQKNLLTQLKSKPKFEIPGLSEIMEKNKQRNQELTGQKTKRIDVHTPQGYTYDLPEASYENYGSYYEGGYSDHHSQDHYAPDPYHSPHPDVHHSPLSYGEPQPVVIEHDLYDENQPLIDINLLADLKYLSKYGHQDTSFSFPKVGDGSKFVDTRQKYYY